MQSQRSHTFEGHKIEIIKHDPRRRCLPHDVYRRHRVALRIVLLTHPAVVVTFDSSRPAKSFSVAQGDWAAYAADCTEDAVIERDRGGWPQARSKPQGPASSSTGPSASSLYPVVWRAHSLSDNRRSGLEADRWHVTRPVAMRDG